MSKGSAPKAPKVPNAGKLLQAASNTTPFGSATVGEEGTNVTLNPELQGVVSGAGGAAQNFVGQLPTEAFSLSDVPQGIDLQSNFFNQQLGLLEPGFNDQLRDFEVRAAERGLPIGSESFAAGLEPLLRSQNLARQQAAFGAVQLTPQEEQRQLANALLERQLPFQEAGQSLGLLNQVPVPQPNPIGSNILNTNFANQNAAFGNQLNSFNQQQAGLGSLLGAVGTIGGGLLGGPFGASLGKSLFGK